MGQGPLTSLSQLLAEELDCDWKQVRTEFAPVDPAYGPLQGTFGSMSIRTCWDPLRKAGASARDMLLEAAAQKWGVAKSQLRTENGQVINTATNARLSYGSLAEAAGKLPAPAKVAVKDPEGVPPHRDLAQAAGHPRQSERHAPGSVSMRGVPAWSTPCWSAAPSSAGRWQVSTPQKPRLFPA